MEQRPNYWHDVYEWLDQAKSPGLIKFDRQPTLVALYFRYQPSGRTSGQHTANILGVSRERVSQLLRRASRAYQKAHPGVKQDKYPDKAVQIHAFMLEYQDKHNTAPSMRVIGDSLPVRCSPGSVQHHIKKLARYGLVKKRVIGRQSQWWAVDE